MSLSFGKVRRVPSDLTRGGYFANVFLGGLFFLAGLRLVFYLEFLLCKRLFVALVILKYVAVGVGVVRSGENKMETDLDCLIPHLPYGGRVDIIHISLAGCSWF